MDLLQYDITQDEVDSYISTLDREKYKPLSVTIEKWGGESFAELSPGQIEQEWGSNFFLVKRDGNLLFITHEDTLDNYLESCINSEIEKEVERHFSNRKKVPEEQKNITILMQSMAELELQNLETQMGQQFLAQQFSDLELAILEGGKSKCLRI